MYWSRTNTERLLERGRADARKQFDVKCFRPVCPSSESIA
jgi:hypothetical protein